MLNKKLITAAALGLSILSANSYATMISAGSNNPLAFSWDYFTGTSNLTGNGTITLSGFNSSQLTANITLNNTSLIGGNGGERLTSFGFGISPNATGVTFSDANDAGMTGALLGQIPSLATVEVCVFGGQNCSGGGNGGIYGAGGSDTFSILLAGNWGNSVEINPIGFKYQTGYGSFEFTTCTSNCGSTPPGVTEVPEPQTLALLGLGLAGMAFTRKRKQAAKA